MQCPSTAVQPAPHSLLSMPPAQHSTSPTHLRCAHPPARSGRPVSDMQTKAAPSGHRRLVRGLVLAILLTVYVLPWGAMAASGAWRPGLTYFLPVMAQASWCWQGGVAGKGLGVRCGQLAAWCGRQERGCLASRSCDHPGPPAALPAGGGECDC